MAQHPINLAVRFFLEVLALASFAHWGWNSFDSPLNAIVAVGLPVAAATAWGVFAVPGDPSRSGKTVVKTPGAARLAFETVFFAAAAIASNFSLSIVMATVFALAVIIHYAASIDRIRWLLKQ
jgi:hypothetical protein